MIREFKFSDAFDIEDIHEKNCSFPLPSYNAPSIIIKKTILHDGVIVGSAFVKLTSETGLILDQSLPQVTKAKIIKRLFNVLQTELAMTDVEDTHVFIVEDDKIWEDFLTKNLNFVRDKGTALVRNIKYEQIKRECGAGLSGSTEAAGQRYIGADSSTEI